MKEMLKHNGTDSDIDNNTKSEEFHLKIYSISRVVITACLIMPVIFFAFDWIFINPSKIELMISGLSAFSLAFYTGYLMGRAKVKVIFTPEAFLHIWESKFIFSSDKNIEIPWDIINNYVFEEDRIFDHFIIKLTNNKRYKITRMNLPFIEDGFDEFLASFPNLADRYRSQYMPENEIKKIEKGESFYATKEFKWIFSIMTVSFISLIIFSIISPNPRTNWGTLGTVASALVLYGIMMKTNIKR